MEKLTAKNIWIHVAVVAVASVLISVVAVWSYASTHPTDKPLPAFTNYDDCSKGGGILTNAAPFNACVGAKYELFLQYSAQNLPRIDERKTSDTVNHVVADSTYSQDLVAFLQHDYTGCVPTGYYKVVKEVKNRFALMQYGCDNQSESQKASTHIIAMKLSDGWALLSPTDNMRGGMPSCLLADMFKVSKELSDKCYETTGYNNGSTREVLYQ